MSVDGTLMPDPASSIRTTAILRRQIEEYVKLRAPGLFIEGILDKIETFTKFLPDLNATIKKLEVDRQILLLEEFYQQLYYRMRRHDYYIYDLAADPNKTSAPNMDNLNAPRGVEVNFANDATVEFTKSGGLRNPMQTMLDEKAKYDAAQQRIATIDANMAPLQVESAELAKDVTDTADAAKEATDAAKTAADAAAADPTNSDLAKEADDAAKAAKEAEDDAKDAEKKNNDNNSEIAKLQTQRNAEAATANTAQSAFETAKGNALRLVNNASDITSGFSESVLNDVRTGPSRGFNDFFLELENVYQYSTSETIAGASETHSALGWVSADGKSVAAVYRNETFATVYDVASGRVLHEVSFDGKFQRVAVNDIFANPNDNLFTLNHDGTMLGVSFSDGSLWIYDLRDSDGDIDLFDETSGFTQFNGGFYQEFFAFAATKPSESLFAVIDTLELVQAGGFDSTNPFSVQADETGIYVQTENIVVNVHPLTGDQTALVDTFERVVRFSRSDTHTIITTKDEFLFFDANAKLIARHEKEYGSDFLQIAEGTALIGSLDAPVIRIMKYESHPYAEVFSYDPSHWHDEARISEDGQTVMLFSYEGFRLYSVNGNLITEVSIPDADHLYDQQFRRDESGSRLEVIYNDGTIRAYSAADGSVLYETVGDPPDLTLYEEFFTDSLRIEAPLHGVPTAYNIATGELVRELEKDAYLTYVTQIGDYILTEYVTGDGFRYGVLLNSQCETLAHLPYLSDFVGDKLIFNYPTGNLRESRIYSIDELIGLAR
jgi:hypothetical protein